MTEFHTITLKLCSIKFYRKIQFKFLQENVKFNFARQRYLTCWWLLGTFDGYGTFGSKLIPVLVLYGNILVIAYRTKTSALNRLRMRFICRLS